MNILNKISKRKPKILVIGDLMLDRYIFGETTRISPEAPVPIVKFMKEKFMLKDQVTFTGSSRHSRCYTINY